MGCRICGDNNGASYRMLKLQVLCPICDKDTPDKMNRSEFDAHYWGSKLSDIPNSIRREFYSDYLSSSLSFTDYKEQTTDKMEE